MTVFSQSFSQFSRSKVGASIVILAALVISLAPSDYFVNAQGQIPVAICPHFDPSNFSNPTKISNPLLPMPQSTSFVYSGTSSDKPTSDVVRITHDTKVVAGVQTVVVNDTVLIRGQKTESTLDYFAQDNAGNVWYFGEYALTFKNGHISGNAGSWLAGVKGAQPGYVMEAKPKVGDFYCQENAPGSAQDQALVISVSASVCVPYSCVHHKAVQTNETSPLEPATVEQKWYVPGPGNVKAMDIAGGDDVTELVAILNG